MRHPNRSSNAWTNRRRREHAREDILQRPITGFGRDADDDWFAVLDCGHRQHVRHRPPFFNRPWVTTGTGRASRLGAPLDCLLCDRFELPDSMQAVERTPVFTAAKLPAWLRQGRASDAGIWTMIVVTEGHLRCIAGEPGRTRELTVEAPGIVPPQFHYRLEPIGPARFYLETYRPPR